MNLGLIAGGVYILYQSDVWGTGEKNEKLVKNLSVKGRKYLPDTAEYVDMVSIKTSDLQRILNSDNITMAGK